MVRYGLVLSAILSVCAAANAATPVGRCDMCSCRAVGKVLKLNCSDTRPVVGENTGVIRQPYQESYDKLGTTSVEAEFERNGISVLQRLTLVNCTKLSLAHNNISEITPGVFTRMKALKTLSMSHNRISKMDRKSFLGLAVLATLDLSNNQIRYFTAETFAELKSLRTLDLSYNRIENLVENRISIGSLQTLDLSNNHIIKVGRFDMTSLKTLSLAHNNVTVIDNEMFISLASLTTLDLSSNIITMLDSTAFSRLRSLRTLHLSDNLLASEFEYEELPTSIQVLSVGRNKIQNLGAAVKKLSQLQELHVEDNKLDALEINCTNLKVLNFSSNILTSFPDGNYRVIEVLDLSGNLLKEVPQGITGLAMPSLRWLSLDNNPIDRVWFPAAGKEEQDAAVFVNLTWVSVSRMGVLERLDAGAFTGLAAPCGECKSNDEVKAGVELEQLKQECNRKLRINVAHNPYLNKVDVAAFKDVGLCSLDLSYNALSSLDEQMINWESLLLVDLQGNPWACTCELQWMLDRVVPHVYNTTPELLYEMRCNSPPQIRDKRLVHFYRWKSSALCSHFEQLKVQSKSNKEEDEDTNVTLGLSPTMLGVVIGLGLQGVVLVIVGIVLQRRFDKKRRMRNRRV